MRRKLRDDLGSLGLAIMLAVIVWVNATYQTDSPTEKFLGEPGIRTAVPITVINAPQNLQQTNEPTPSVRIKVRAFDSSWASLSAKSFAVQADWSNVTPGMNQIPIKVTCSDPTVTILEIDPPVQQVFLEEIKREGKPVTLNLTNQDGVPLGYRVSAPMLTPENVKVTGAASAVDAVDHLELTLSLLNQNASIERIMEPKPVDTQGNLVQGVTLDPTTVSVKIAIEKKQNYREVAVRARTSGQPARGYYVSGVNVVPSTVTLVGPPSIIDTMGGIVDLVEEIDITGATRMVADRLALDLPAGVSVVGSQEGEVFAVLATVGVDAVTGGTTVELPVNITKLPEGLVAKLSVPTVDVILTGPSVLLDELQTDLLQAYVDLSGLGEGTHQIRPQVDILAAQDSTLRDLVVKDISPKYVEVTISLPSTATATPTLRVTLTPTMTPDPTRGITGTATITSTRSMTVTTTTTATPTATSLGDLLPDAATSVPITNTVTIDNS